MKSLIEWAERRGREAVEQKAAQLAEEMREFLSVGIIEATEAAVIVSGKELIKRWLIDPELRFLIGDVR